MGSDNRDWYRDWWRKKTGYAERAAFRISETEHKKHKYRSAWKRNLYAVLAIVLAVFVASILRKFLGKN